MDPHCLVHEKRERVENRALGIAIGRGYCQKVETVEIAANDVDKTCLR